VSDDVKDGVKDKALEQARKCPVCEGSKVPSLPENYIVLGMVTRDVVPMETLASILCDRHTQLTLYYYDLMVAISMAYHNIDKTEGTPIEVPTPLPPKDMN
jgi:hypothetical protein